MNVNDTEILICNCGKTMPLDPKKITAGCELNEEVTIYNSLCTDQIDIFAFCKRLIWLETAKHFRKRPYEYCPT